MARESTPQSMLTREQKTGIVLLLIFGVLAVGLGFLQMRNTIYDPFVVHIDETTRDLTALFANTDARLQQIDTDHDGLTDYDELTFYTTSPYLPDTDSDGVADKEEITAGSDPLCPQGQICAAEETVPTSTSTTSIVSPLLNLNATTTSLLPLRTSTPNTSGTMSKSEFEALVRNPQALRELLLSTGQITEAQLTKISDEALLRMAEQQLQKNTSNTTASTSNSLNVR